MEMTQLHGVEKQKWTREAAGTVKGGDVSFRYPLCMFFSILLLAEYIVSVSEIRLLTGDNMVCVPEETVTGNRETKVAQNKWACVAFLRKR